ncbi:hypothetical protein [Pseudosulfitobacter pseudonitzschiae]|uniref:hypothetical protein n=1 Tax=Pseudosulfitobacter pseudonitzschiae TaxID=1402135 RepID=UPI001AF81822|nr:hypothetical protein [Pseudosulfitobacter pseudonitzschiae]MBM1816240.1 hypothetical protein [Pseudosulfitobacter pseudonitzschiae]MBM1833739.1 hypothetical protein [Pseudosulfitobacter pseudonitzschiae]MBM1838605.1 hypothetical protein [Pseudosulfitobacter pseudonitzschiae]MBM1842953.1 hypothetical protein [Pseudosulfitobacter pseudonitzschiae]MBM1847819.1 hypothetical protein [Pseudosulfitobacter pseudonitzschiae]
MKRSRHAVTDHAVVRYLERVAGMDITALRTLIGLKVESGLEQGASGVVSDGFVYKLRDGVVTTVTPHNTPDRRTMRRARTSEFPDD